MNRTVANLLSGLGLLLALAAVAGARSWPAGAGTFPTLIGWLVGGLATVNLVLSNLGHEKAANADSVLDLRLAPAEPKHELREVGAILGWMGGYLLATCLLGFAPASLLFVCLYLRCEGREGWPVTMTTTVLTGLFIYLLFSVVLKTPAQPGWLLLWLRRC